MNKIIIDVNHITKSYGPNKGVFNLSFQVNQGEVFGFIGPNGAGKTTTIRQLLGFIQPEEGSCSILGMDSRNDASMIQESLGYLPGEISFFDQMTGQSFLDLLCELRHLNDLSYRKHLVTYFDLDTNGKIRKMSKGMKQKLALVAAFMHEPQVLILDEPTSGLDPLMQSKFVELILEEKKKGKTILMSSHSFEEIERTCDRAGIIKEGVLVALEDIHHLKQSQRKAYRIRFKYENEAKAFEIEGFDSTPYNPLEYDVTISGDVNPLIKSLGKYVIESLEIKIQSLEEIFMDYYKGSENQ
ncbi:MAG: ABC transporter ATP-binding protein [Acholeplasmataceae bacterium]|nr:ABC transporter ATP-binding protein [Acholeplasmataceae bacterium]